MTKNTKIILCWIFASIMLIIGILNLILVHPVPGIFYILVAVLFSPLLNNWFRKNLKFEIPFIVITLLFLVIMWGTLGITDLAEIMGI